MKSIVTVTLSAAMGFVLALIWFLPHSAAPKHPPALEPVPRFVFLQTDLNSKTYWSYSNATYAFVIGMKAGMLISSVGGTEQDAEYFADCVSTNNFNFVSNWLAGRRAGKTNY